MTTDHPRVTTPTAAQLLDRHARLLAKARMSRAELDERAEAGTLDADRYGLLDDIRSVEFLLGGETGGTDRLRPAPDVQVGARPQAGGHVGVIRLDHADVWTGTRVHDDPVAADREAAAQLGRMLHESASTDLPGFRDCCWRCRDVRLAGLESFTARLAARGMLLCASCGNKRCPQAADHRQSCTGSNTSGQPGSAYPHVGPRADLR